MSCETKADWALQGACNHADPELFFPVGNGYHALAQVEQAKAYCAACPVRAECLSFALSSGVEHGVWGGTTEEEREAVIRFKSPRARDGHGRPKPPRGTMHGKREVVATRERR